MGSKERILNCQTGESLRSHQKPPWIQKCKNSRYSRNQQNRISILTHWKRRFHLSWQRIPRAHPGRLYWSYGLCWKTSKSQKRASRTRPNHTRLENLTLYVHKFLSGLVTGFEIFLATFSQTHSLIGTTASDGVAAVVAVTFDEAVMAAEKEEQRMKHQEEAKPAAYIGAATRPTQTRSCSMFPTARTVSRTTTRPPTAGLSIRNLKNNPTTKNAARTEGTINQNDKSQQTVTRTNTILVELQFIWWHLQRTPTFEISGPLTLVVPSTYHTENKISSPWNHTLEESFKESAGAESNPKESEQSNWVVTFEDEELLCSYPIPSFIQTLALTSPPSHN